MAWMTSWLHFIFVQSLFWYTTSSAVMSHSVFWDSPRQNVVREGKPLFFSLFSVQPVNSIPTRCLALRWLNGAVGQPGTGRNRLVGNQCKLKSRDKAAATDSNTENCLWLYATSLASRLALLMGLVLARRPVSLLLLLLPLQPLPLRRECLVIRALRGWRSTGYSRNAPLKKDKRCVSVGLVLF